jgi:hypothetical protein
MTIARPNPVPITLLTAHRLQTRRLGPILYATALALSLALQFGCRPSPAVERRVQMRRDRVAGTAQAFGQSEARRPEKVATAAAYVPMSLERSTTRLRRNAQWFVEWQRRDVRRFQDRGPTYRDEAGRMLWGKPERLEPMSAYFF